jgi:hypothetical protein
MSDSHDPYWKLRVPEGTSEEDLCGCDGTPPLLLQAHLAFNPIVCASCEREVEPERVGFGAELANRIYEWQTFHDCFYILWLDSREFEQWAKAQLRDPGSPVNTRALEVVEELNQFRRTYYWWFRDEGALDDELSAACPRCGKAMSTDWGHRICEQCSILVP